MQREERIAIVVAEYRRNLIVGAAPRNQITDTHGYLLSVSVSFPSRRADGPTPYGSCPDHALGGQLLHLDLLVAGLQQSLARGDGDTARLHLFRNLALQVDSQQTVHKIRAHDLHVVGKLKAPPKGACGN